jgi:hypothetical protein
VLILPMSLLPWLTWLARLNALTVAGLMPEPRTSTAALASG